MSADSQHTGSMPPLKIDPSRASTLLQNISSINARITTACKNASIQHQPRLVAVSKLKPATDILALHQTSDSSQSHLHFGENYVQELIQKSQLLPKEIQWHFIGGLQSNKCAQLAKEVQNLWAVESVDSVKKVNLLDKGRAQRNEQLGQDDPLHVFVQINTSGEDSKSGVEPKSDELLEVCKAVQESKCLKLQGVMTIGAIARSKATTAETENEDFINLRANRDWIAKKQGLNPSDLELSMGMSEDFEGAIRQGSNEVRVGSTIFGERPPKSEAKVLENTEEEKK